MDQDLFGKDLLGNSMEVKAAGKLAEKFMLPPFSVLNAREGWWQARKAAWLALGIESEVGRAAPTGGSARKAADYSNRERGDVAGRAIPKNPQGRGKNLTFQGGAASIDGYRVKEGLRDSTTEQGTSIFDPTLCELAYRWFAPPGGQIIDPFAGGSVRGIVAARLGYKYWGCDLRPEQIEANGRQAAALCPDNKPVWACGDAADELDTAPRADFVFSCPPYGDLERYSDDPRDLSAMDHPRFVEMYNFITEKACKALKPNRFAGYVIGNYRNPDTGLYRDLVGETIAAFKEAGCGLYNEAILVTQVASLSIRAEAQFTASRKLGKTHQNVLVFIKGDPVKAAAACGEVKTIA